jgi:hypothetical protein
MTVYDVSLFLIISPMAWLPIYQICEFVYRQRQTASDLKIFPILEEEEEEEEASGAMSGTGDEPVAATNESPAAAAVAASAVGTHGGMVKLKVSDTISSRGGAWDVNDGCQSDGNGNEAQKIPAEGLIVTAAAHEREEAGEGAGAGGAGDEVVEMEEGFV